MPLHRSALHKLRPSSRQATPRHVRVGSVGQCNAEGSIQPTCNLKANSHTHLRAQLRTSTREQRPSSATHCGQLPATHAPHQLQPGLGRFSVAAQQVSTPRHLEQSSSKQQQPHQESGTSQAPVAAATGTTNGQKKCMHTRTRTHQSTRFPRAAHAREMPGVSLKQAQLTLRLLRMWVCTQAAVQVQAARVLFMQKSQVPDHSAHTAHSIVLSLTTHPIKHVGGKHVGRYTCML